MSVPGPASTLISPRSRTACRHGDLEEVKQFVAKHGASQLDVADERNNTVLHFCAANGHAGEASYRIRQSQAVD